MRGYIGAILIVTIYTMFSNIFDSSPLKEVSTFIGITYFSLLLLLIVNGALVNKLGFVALFLWIFFSVIPGSGFILYARFSDNTGGFISFPWDWGLWEFFLPIIVGVIQIIFLIIFLTIRNNNKEIKVQSES